MATMCRSVGFCLVLLAILATASDWPMYAKAMVGVGSILLALPYLRGGWCAKDTRSA